jgi:hypothetical protein
MASLVWDRGSGEVDSDTGGECSVGSDCIFGSGDCGQD